MINKQHCQIMMDIQPQQQVNFWTVQCHFNTRRRRRRVECLCINWQGFSFAQFVFMVSNWCWNVVYEQKEAFHWAFTPGQMTKHYISMFENQVWTWFGPPGIHEAITQSQTNPYEFCLTVQILSNHDIASANLTNHCSFLDTAPIIAGTGIKHQAIPQQSHFLAANCS